MFVPEDTGKTYSLHLHRNLLRSFVAILLLFLAGIGALVAVTGQIGVKLQLVDTLREENSRLKSENKKLRIITAKLHNMQNLSSYLHRLAVAMGEDTAMPPIASLLSQHDEKVIAEDSLDHFLNAVRFSQSENYKELSRGAADPSEILSAIPNILPVEGWITRRFRLSPATPSVAHPGVDFAAAEGTLIRSSAPGVVETIIHDKYFGLMVTVKHSFGFATRYGHCSQVLVTEGDHVERGQTIALVGNTGRSSGPHLHYEVHKNGKPVNPLHYTLDRSPNL
jgi:murein DD-endopeptidase MepM/ murein hydrolase activator NlpD